MDFPSTQFVPSRMMGTYEPIHQIGMWGENFKSIGNPSISASVIVEVDNKLENESETASHEMPAPSCKHDQEASKPFDKIQRRLAQNREAARKSRLRKKAYVQQLESSRLKLIQLEKELEQAREQQGLYIGGGLEAGHLGFSGVVNPGDDHIEQKLKKGLAEQFEIKDLGALKYFLGMEFSRSKEGIAAFEMEYKHWMQVQNRQLGELRTALNAQISDIELRIVVENGMSHYFELFRMKSTVAKADVFYVMSGTWKTSAERFFSWIGGFRPSELLKVLVAQLDPLTDQQIFEVCNLKQSCQQAEDALSQGMEKLQETVSATLAAGQLGQGTYFPQVAMAMEKLEALVCFVNQADHLRQETLQQMSHILTTRQAARGLLALGEYIQRLQDLSTLWATHPREPA
ncbi:transcription factor TGA4 isoform X1 [Gossypium raimondii]|uniref:transcription factor TGA4 isoform X1 n=1 Tax=Gossypium raimondii TaxID=29730 RepID=UPI00063A94F3|nr:transcription factor TGA4 isoform X1 [Gossypium raimondii]XP_012437431.1 transcription factor TGA4 isoform X1 [Gossypium raimondii]XP_052481483.1 transcription factor TGA4 isoform X1 [Gossypium raimondii]